MTYMEKRGVFAEAIRYARRVMVRVSARTSGRVTGRVSVCGKTGELRLYWDPPGRAYCALTSYAWPSVEKAFVGKGTIGGVMEQISRTTPTTFEGTLPAFTAIKADTVEELAVKLAVRLETCS